MRLFVVASTVLVLSSAFDRRAEAFECTKVSNGAVSQAWLSRCVPYAISTRNEFLLDDQSLSAVKRSFDVWESVNCSDFRFMHVGYTPETESFDVSSPFTQFNSIAILDSSDADLFPVSNLLALTFTHFVVDTGEILDADIVFNADQFDFVDVNTLAECRPEADRTTFDFENTLVHEIGHFIGFDHVNIADATMHAEARACEILKRTLSPDDEDGICSVYPSGGPLTPCMPPPNGHDGQLDTELFRGQCDRYLSGDRVPLSVDEARSLVSPGGCSCDAASAPSRSSAPLGWLGLLLLGARSRRRLGRVG